MKREGGMRTWMVISGKKGGALLFGILLLLLFLVWGFDVQVRLAKGYGMGCDDAIRCDGVL